MRVAAASAPQGQQDREQGQERQEQGVRAWPDDTLLKTITLHFYDKNLFPGASQFMWDRAFATPRAKLSHFFGLGILQALCRIKGVPIVSQRAELIARLAPHVSAQDLETLTLGDIRANQVPLR
jgi:hypothetical protein